MDQLADNSFDANGLINETSYSVNGYGAMLNDQQDFDHKSNPLVSTVPSQLISPQLTNTPSPAGHFPSTLNMTPAAPVQANKSSHSPGRNLQSTTLHVNPHHTPANSASSNASLQVSPSEALNRAASPILLVSTYNRGDSPSRPASQITRNSSKRSRTAQDSSFLAPVDHLAAEDPPEEPSGDSDHGLPNAKRTNDGAWLPNTSSGQTGLAPSDRGDIYVPSIKDMDETRRHNEKNDEITTWLSKSEAGSDYDEGPKATRRTSRKLVKRDRPRARSTGGQVDTLELGPRADGTIPGPGALIDEDSGDAYSEDSASQISAEREVVASPPAQVDLNDRNLSDGYFTGADHIAPDDEEPSLSQFIGTRLSQAPHANAAMFTYERMSAQQETASRVATWGTRRRLSDTDIQSVVSGDVVRKLSLAQKTRARGNTLVRKASNLLPRRASSTSKRKEPDAGQEDTTFEPAQKMRTDSLTPFRPLQRIPSISKGQKSPPLNTGSAFLAMTGQITAVGRSTSATPESQNTATGPWNPLKRQRSKSEIPKTKSSNSPGLAQLMTNIGGPPVPRLPSPMQEKPSAGVADQGSDKQDDMAGEDDVTVDDEGIKLDLDVRSDNIIPTIEGFRTHARSLNPRLEIFLVERIVSEQSRRYKKLVENKVKHTHAVRISKECPSRGFCFELGGEAKELPPRPNLKDPEATGAQFQVAGNDDSDGEVNTFPEGIVTAAQFPVGIPLPPVKKLPAEFECPLCFKVKKFQKPSDWTKHVHEDVQPFTCTFPHCSEARSFKRKADWVRHENERHRHLEWWQCDMADCVHKCFRKDNFVQHLVREHKKREPKVKSRSGAGNKNASVKHDSIAAWQAKVEDEEIAAVWAQVDSCHFETQKKPKEEACKFCGNVCGSWKKLTVHLAKHMEQIAMPVLHLVKQREVSPDTIISPVNQRTQAALYPTSPGQTMNQEQSSLSPYGGGTNPHFATLQAQSPSAYSHDSHYSHSIHNSPSFSHTPTSGYDDQVVGNTPSMADFAQMHNLPTNMSYGPYQNLAQQPALVGASNHGSAPNTYPPPFNAVRHSPQQAVANHSQHHSQTHPAFIQTHPSYNLPTQQVSQHGVFSSPTDAGPYNVPFVDGMSQMHGYESEPMNYGQTDLPEMTPNVLYGVQQARPYSGPDPGTQGYTYTSQ